MLLGRSFGYGHAVATVKLATAAFADQCRSVRLVVLKRKRKRVANAMATGGTEACLEAIRLGWLTHVLTATEQERDTVDRYLAS